MGIDQQANGTGTPEKPEESTQKAVKETAAKAAKEAVKSSKPTPTKPKGKGKGKPQTAVPAWTFPKNTLEEALKVPKAIEEKFAGNPTKAEDIVKAVGFARENDWRYLNLLRSSMLYGLTSGTGATATISLEKLGEDIVSPDSPEQRQKALLEAFRKVDDFKKVEEFYKGKKIPEDEFFENTLTRQFNILRDRVQTFAQVFLANLVFLKAFRAGETSSEQKKATLPTLSDAVEPKDKREESVREFLDTCFVMMPFGGWNDAYYKEVYVPAVKEAGFEPVRGDEVFSSGSVVEQIWEQIEKAKVLLADLTGKNPNVFYELGLAHAARKPVVFTSGSLDDVPFDLRHLRMIIYETREPNWNAKLKASITAFLKSAKSEPEKSIPQPFRNIDESGQPKDPQNGKSAS
ncbi:MAG: hypothetical protein IT462_10220 [Planctomycetes bacterium]|nr:hypothetical protein [Planctomycetota bacterium]